MNKRISKIDLAVPWLFNLLQDKGQFKEIILKLGEEHPCKFSEATLRRAYDRLNLTARPILSEKEVMQGQLAILKRARSFGEMPADEEAIQELQKALLSTVGYVRWVWELPGDPELLRSSYAELEQLRDYHLAEAQHVADILSRRPQPVTDQSLSVDQSTSEPPFFGADLPDDIRQFAAELIKNRQIGSQLSTEPEPAPKPAAEPTVERTSNVRF